MYAEYGTNGVAVTRAGIGNGVEQVVAFGVGNGFDCQLIGRRYGSRVDGAFHRSINLAVILVERVAGGRKVIHFADAVEFVEAVVERQALFLA